MPLHFLDNTLWFPPVADALEDGLLAIGGDLAPERLLLAYRNGIFPWYSEEEPPMWWCPHPRFVLFPAELRVSKSMKQVINRNEFEFRTNTAFSKVIAACSAVERRDQPGTWISGDIIAAYTSLHNMGIVHSAEAWHGDELVGGLYGVWLGDIFFGESMFSTCSNASKFAFIKWVELLQAQGVVLIDCQVYTEHLESLGARMVGREEFVEVLQTNIQS
ncbi:MAG: leucyl/phenylalanyl-tRNA--protein transferase [Bacteroidota bacterium]